MDSVLRILVTWTLLPLFSNVLLTFHGPVEVCQWEDFKAECSDDEMIVVTKAVYGRMQQGRCVRRDFGYLGCETDVLDIMHQHCSGRHQCDYKVTNLHEAVKCPKDLTAYLTISYNCTKVVNCEKKMCESSDYLKVAPSIGYLSSQVTWESSCGTSPCPWVIQAQPGQRINITLMDFSGGHNQLSSDSDPGKICYRYATMKESNTITRDVTLCLGEERNEANHIYLSETNYLSVTFYTAEKKEELFFYAIKYEVLGCPTLTAPRNAWVKHTGDSVVVYCNSTKKEWHLRCTGTSWIGEVGTCDEGRWTIEPLVEGGSPAFGMLVIIGLGVAIGVVVGGMLLAVTLVYLKRRRSGPVVRGNTLLGENGIYSDRVPRYEAGETQKNPVSLSYKESVPPYSDNGEHDYTCTLPYRHQIPGGGGVLVEERGRDPRSVRCESIPGDSGVDSTDFPPLPDFANNREHIYESPTFPMQAGVPMRGSRTQSADGISRKVPHDEGCSNRTN